MTPDRYPIGARVSGRNCLGAPFSGTVTARIGPFSVMVDGVGTPVSLIERSEHEPPASAAPSAECGQLSLF